MHGAEPAVLLVPVLLLKEILNDIFLLSIVFCFLLSYKLEWGNIRSHFWQFQTPLANTAQPAFSFSIAKKVRRSVIN